MELVYCRVWVAGKELWLIWVWKKNLGSHVEQRMKAWVLGHTCGQERLRARRILGPTVEELGLVGAGVS